MSEQFAARIAEAYGHHSEKYAPILEPILKPMADEMIRMVGLKGGILNKGLDSAVLDLATGTGLIARGMREFTQAVVGIDISLGMLVRAQHLAAGEIPFILGDGHCLPFREQCFDIVTCGISLSHFSDIPKALEEVKRVLRPGGSFITSAWGSEGENPSKAAAIEVRRRFLKEREVLYGGSFSEEMWEDVEQGCEVLRQAGFTDVQVRTQSLCGEYRNPSEAVETALAWPLTRYRIAQMDASDQEKLRQETAAAINEVGDLRWQAEIHYYQASCPQHPRGEDI